MIQMTLKIGQKVEVYQALERASKRLSGVKRNSEERSAEQANGLAEQANKRVVERAHKRTYERANKRVDERATVQNCICVPVSEWQRLELEVGSKRGNFVIYGKFLFAITRRQNVNIGNCDPLEAMREITRR